MHGFAVNETCRQSPDAGSDTGGKPTAPVDADVSSAQLSTWGRILAAIGAAPLWQPSGGAPARNGDGASGNAAAGVAAARAASSRRLEVAMACRTDSASSERRRGRAGAACVSHGGGHGAAADAACVECGGTGAAAGAAGAPGLGEYGAGCGACGGERRATGAGSGDEREAEDDDGLQCTVCLIDFSLGDMLRTLPCGHEFHAECIDSWMDRNLTCPLCRRTLWEGPERENSAPPPTQA